MTDLERIGQRLVTGFPGTALTPELVQVVKEYKIGNIILFRENIASADQLRTLCADLQTLIRSETGHDAFIMIDQEGGAVTRLPESCINVPGSMALAATGDPETTYLAGKLTGEELRSLGVNFNLAPSVDVNCNPANPIIGVRSYGDTPATMSRRIVTGLLRGEMSFTGLVTSDCMEMQAVQKFFGSVNGVLAAMNAGVDLVLLSHTTLLSGEAAKAAAEALQSGKLDRKEMEESVDRILAAKAKLAAVPAAAFDAEQAAALNDKLLRATITEVHVPKAGRPNVGGHPLCLGCQVYRTGLVGNVVDDVQQSFPVMMAKALGGDGFTTPIDPSEDEIYEWVRRAESYTSIVIGTYNGHLHPQQLEMVKALAQNSGKPVTVVALRNPYDLFPLPESVYTLAAYEYTARSTAAVADVLLGRHAATGRLPIATPEQEAQ